MYGPNFIRCPQARVESWIFVICSTPNPPMLVCLYSSTVHTAVLPTISYRCFRPWGHMRAHGIFTIVLPRCWDWSILQVAIRLINYAWWPGRLSLSDTHDEAGCRFYCRSQRPDDHAANKLFSPHEHAAPEIPRELRQPSSGGIW
jgi:hypothetical protein